MSRYSDLRAEYNHTLYRAYDKLGCLLYVGITYDIKSRMNNHRKQSGWYGDTVYVEYEVFPNRHTAAWAEYEAIVSESPIYNRQTSKPR